MSGGADAPAAPPRAALADPLALTRALIRCPSVTPREAGALDLLQAALEALGFACHRLPFHRPGTEAVDNLYARLGTGRPNFCFAGHTDVVPTGDPEGWTVDPFAAEVIDGWVYGRGAADMKGAIACFVAAVARHLEGGRGVPGSISLLITGDEEGPAVNGTRPVLDWLAARGEALDHCLVGEPTNPLRLGEMMKIGRRGSINSVLTVFGIQGHVAYPHLADNPVHRLVRMLDALTARPLDAGSAHFQPSVLQVTSIDVGNPATNVVPPRAVARFNIRFNDRHSGAGLERWIRETVAPFAGASGFELSCVISGESFLTPPGLLSEIVAEAAAAVTGRAPEASTTGGTSDARFIVNACPVLEFGLVGQTMHKVDERTAIADLEALTAIYGGVLERYFARAAGSS